MLFLISNRGFPYLENLHTITQQATHYTPSHNRRHIHHHTTGDTLHTITQQATHTTITRQATHYTPSHDRRQATGDTHNHTTFDTHTPSHKRRHTHHHTTGDTQTPSHDRRHTHTPPHGCRHTVWKGLADVQ